MTRGWAVLNYLKAASGLKQAAHSPGKLVKFSYDAESTQHTGKAAALTVDHSISSGESEG